MEIENETVSEQESLHHLNLCFQKLNHLNESKTKSDKIISLLTRMLPYLARDYLNSNVSLIEKYIPALNFYSKGQSFFLSNNFIFFTFLL